MKSLKKITFIFAAFTALIFAGCSNDVNNNHSTSEKVLESVKITTDATKTEYFTGEELDTAGLELTATYSDNSTKTVTDWTVSGFDSKNAHTVQEITITYTENEVTKSDTYTVKIKSIELVSISVTAPEKTEYNVNDTPDRTGMVVTASYNNGSTKEISDFTDDFDTKLGTSGVKTVTVYYGSKTAVFEISVSPSWLVSISVTAPEKTEYFQCEDFNAAGMVVTALKSDGTSAGVTDYTTDFAEKVQLTGEQTVTVTYEGKTANFTIKVTALEVTELYIARKPSKLEYIEDEKIDLTGLVVRAKFNNNSVKTITEYTTDMEGQLQSAGTKNVTISYGGKSVSYSINISEKVLQQITLSGDCKTQYYENDEFDPTNLTVTASYNNGKTYEISQSGDNSDSTTGWTYAGLDTTTDGNQTITVTYSGKTAEFTANVSLTDSIVLDATSAKTVYYFNDEFDSTGLEVKLHYTNGREIVLTDTEYSTNFSSLNTTIGDKTVTVTYEIFSKTYTKEYSVRIIAKKVVISKLPNKTEYYINDSFCSAGMEITAYNEDDEILNITNYTTDFYEQITSVGTKKITVTCYGPFYNTFEITVKAHAEEPTYKFQDAVTKLEAGTDGTVGTEGDYALFGDMPCSEKEDDVNIDETLWVTHGDLTFYYGFDGNYYALSNGKYYKVEPCKWRILSSTTSQIILISEYIYMLSNYGYSKADTTNNGIVSFKNNAFTTEAAKIIKNSRIFSTDDYANTDYGFADDNSRIRTRTKYAQNIYDNLSTSKRVDGYWTSTYYQVYQNTGSYMYYVNSAGEIKAETSDLGDLCERDSNVLGVIPAITVTYSE